MESFWLLHHAPSCAAIAPHFIRQLPPDQVVVMVVVVVGGDTGDLLIQLMQRYSGVVQPC